MGERIWVWPAPGLDVPDPEMSDLFPPGGREVVLPGPGFYYQRRLKAGELLDRDPRPATVTPPEPPPPPPAEPPVKPPAKDLAEAGLKRFRSSSKAGG